MATDLDQLLADIDPDRTIEQVFQRADDAINSFPVRKAQFTTWNEFTACMADFVQHAECHALRLRLPIRASHDFLWGRAANVLIRVYGVNGEKAAFELARTGNEGGLYGVLKAVAMRIAEDMSETEIAARVNAFWQGHSADEVLDAAQQYLARYGHLLPSELTEGSAARIRASFLKVLENHPKLVQRLRRVGR